MSITNEKGEKGHAHKNPWQTPAIIPLPLSSTETGNAGVVETDGSTGPLTS